MKDILDLDRYPLDREGSAEWKRLVEQSIAALRADGMFNLEGFLRPGIAEKAVREIKPVMDTQSHVHKRMHNIYFKPRHSRTRTRPSRPAQGRDHQPHGLRRPDSRQHRACHLRIRTAGAFPGGDDGQGKLHVMQDPLARTNVMAYRAGEALNWHFDRSEFTTTLLLQQSQRGGDLEYRTDLRSDDNPNYEGVARLLEGRDPDAKILRMKPGTLNVFRGKNTAHRVTTVEGERERMIAVFSYYEKPGVMFSAEERVGFYGRAA